MDRAFLDRKKIARARLVGRPAGEVVLDRIGDEPLQAMRVATLSGV